MKLACENVLGLLIGLREAIKNKSLVPTQP